MRVRIRTDLLKIAQAQVESGDVIPAAGDHVWIDGQEFVFRRRVWSLVEERLVLTLEVEPTGPRDC